MNCLTNPFSQKNAIELFTLVLTNINRILQADPDLAMYNIGGGDGGKDLVWILAIKIVAGI